MTITFINTLRRPTGPLDSPAVGDLPCLHNLIRMLHLIRQDNSSRWHVTEQEYTDQHFVGG
jgi:hypothetical protein